MKHILGPSFFLSWEASLALKLVVSGNCWRVTTCQTLHWSSMCALSSLGEAQRDVNFINDRIIMTRLVLVLPGATASTWSSTCASASGILIQDNGLGRLILVFYSPSSTHPCLLLVQC